MPLSSEYPFPSSCPKGRHFLEVHCALAAGATLVSATLALHPVRWGVQIHRLAWEQTALGSTRLPSRTQHHLVRNPGPVLRPGPPCPLPLGSDPRALYMHTSA